jgi:hypothetical protein
MDRIRASALFILGLIMTFGAVGGIENSLTDRELLITTGVALVGCVIMWFGVQIMKVDGSAD